MKNDGNILDGATACWSDPKWTLARLLRVPIESHRRFGNKRITLTRQLVPPELHAIRVTLEKQAKR